MSEYGPYIEPYQHDKGGLLEALHALRKEYNHIPEKALKELAKAFNISDSQVYGVASFYSFMNFSAQGEYVIRVCRSVPCYMAGSSDLMGDLEEYFGIKAGTLTGGKYSLEWVECIGQCQGAPAVMINDMPLEKADVEKIRSFLAAAQSDE